MEERRRGFNDELFWTLMSWFAALIMAGTIAYVFAVFYGAGWRSGAALGAAVFVVAGWIFSRSANASDLPPPNTVRAPTAPKGGAFQAPAGGAFQAPASAGAAWSAVMPTASAKREAPPQAQSELRSAERTVEHAAHAAGEAISNSAASARAAVTGAIQAAKAAVSGTVSDAEDKAGKATRLMGGEARAVEDKVEAAVERMRPAWLDAPRAGGADDLKRIKGVGPKLEELLHSLGFYHFDQIAGWKETELAWVDSNLEGFNGRATRDDWVGQAVILAAGGETEHSQRVDKGLST